MRRLITPVLLIATMAGCGTSERQEVAATLRAHDAAVERGDYDEICARLTERGRREFLRHAINPAARTCAEAYTEPPVDGATFTMALEELYVVETDQPPVRLTSIEVNGDRAVVRYADGYNPRTLRRIRGRWRIDDF